MLIFLDIETTGLESTDKIVSIGLIAQESDNITSIYELVNEGKKIPPLASSINHITNEMIKDKPKLQDSKAYKFLQEHNTKDTTIVAHNVKFDLQKLSTCGFEFQGTIIDTLRVSKHLIKECESFALQFLRYELKLYKNEKQEALTCEIEDVLSAHNAISDALFVKLLYEYLLDLADKEQMIELSFKNVLMEKFDFGKYSGRYIEEVAMIDSGYLQWMLANVTDLDEDLKYSIEYYM